MRIFCWCDYSACNEINKDSLAFARTKIPLKSGDSPAVDVLLNLKGTRSYNIKLMEMVSTHRGFSVNKAAWVIEGRLSGFLSRMFGSGSVLSHRVALFEDVDEALAWLRRAR